MSAVLRVGLVGCGSIADTIEDELRAVPGWLPFPYSHATVFEAHPRTELVAVAEPDRHRRSAFATRWGVERQYDGIEAMVDHERLDIVAIASPTHHHAHAFTVAAEAGVPGVFLEKPVAQTLREADAMIELAARRGTAAIVNHFRSFDPSFRAAARLVGDGTIGEVTGMVAIWGEGLSQGGCHLFDLIRLLLGRRVQWVFAELDHDESLVDPGGDIVLGLGGDVRAMAHMPWRVGVPPQIEIAGTTGKVRMSNYEREVVAYRTVNGRPVPQSMPFPARSATRSGMLVALDELIDQMETGARPSSGLPEGRDALEITAALLASGARRDRLDLPFTDLDAVVTAWL